MRWSSNSAAEMAFSPPQAKMQFGNAPLEKVNGEWLLWGTTHNINKLWRFLKQRKIQAMAIG
jgi:hypothetical protein